MLCLLFVSLLLLPPNWISWERRLYLFYSLFILRIQTISMLNTYLVNELVNVFVGNSEKWALVWTPYVSQMWLRNCLFDRDEAALALCRVFVRLVWCIICYQTAEIMKKPQEFPGMWWYFKARVYTARGKMSPKMSLSF